MLREELRLLTPAVVQPPRVRPAGRETRKYVEDPRRPVCWIWQWFRCPGRGWGGHNKIICWGDHPAECSAPSSPQLFQLSTLTSVRLQTEALLKPRGRRMQLWSVYLRHSKTPACAVPSVRVSARHWKCTERSCPSHFIAQ